jgi:hypothetical protein
MIRLIFAVLVFVATLGANFSYAQQAVHFKNFVTFKQLVPGIDFFASNRQAVAPYEKPAAEVMMRLKSLFKDDLPKGAIFICSNLAQKDAVYEPVVLKKGYGWTLTAVTSEVRMQEVMERMKAQMAQMGGNIPAEIRQRLQNRQPTEMMANAEKQMVDSMVQNIAYAVLQSMLGENIQFRSSRVDDVGKSPLPDWLDIGIAAYASNSKSSLTYLQQNMEQTFSLEDVLSMSRPFVAVSSDQGGGGRNRGGDSDGGQGMPRMNGGGGFPSGGFPGGGMPGGGMPGGGFPGGGMAQGTGRTGGGAGRGGFSGNGGGPNGMQRNLPKDEQDRMLFDGQSSTLFAYLIEKAGIEKIRELIQYVREGKESREFIITPEVLGPDFEKIEGDWAAWVKSQKP